MDTILILAGIVISLQALPFVIEQGDYIILLLLAKLVNPFLFPFAKKYFFADLHDNEWGKTDLNRQCSFELHIFSVSDFPFSYCPI